MGVQTIRGIILKEMVVGESNKRLVVFAKDRGKCLLSAKGAKNPKSKLMAGSQPFCYCDFQVFEGKGFLSITQIDILERFYGLQTDIKTLAYGIYLAELLDQVAMEGMENNDLLELFLRVLSRMAKGQIDPQLASRIFECKLLDYYGWKPQLNQCVLCGGDLGDALFFHHGHGGMVCNAHKAGSCTISLGAKQAMEYIFSKEGNAVFSFALSKEVLVELGGITKEFLREYTNTTFRSLDFAESI